jgi:hypothetical protein
LRLNYRLVPRRLFNLATAVSLALLAATCAMWARSYPHFDTVGHNRMRDGGVTMLTVISRWGQLSFYHSHHTPPHPSAQAGWVAWSNASGGILRGPLSDRNLGFGFSHVPQQRAESYLATEPENRHVYQTRYTVLLVPYWFVGALCTIFPLASAGRRLARWKRERALQRIGYCRICGYDLRATPQGGRCPECGTPVPAAPPAPSDAPASSTTNGRSRLRRE